VRTTAVTLERDSDRSRLREQALPNQLINAISHSNEQLFLLWGGEHQAVLSDIGRVRGAEGRKPVMVVQLSLGWARGPEQKPHQVDRGGSSHLKFPSTLILYESTVTYQADLWRERCFEAIY